MEVFKYTTSSHYEAIKSAGSLNPRPVDGYTYGIPENPLLWGEHIQEVLLHLEKYRGASPIVLLKFLIDELDQDAFVQEGDEDVWFKAETRRPLSNYNRDDYRLPEVVVRRPISLEEITVVESIPNFGR